MDNNDKECDGNLFFVDDEHVACDKCDFDTRNRNVWPTPVKAKRDELYTHHKTEYSS